MLKAKRGKWAFNAIEIVGEKHFGLGELRKTFWFGSNVNGVLDDKTELRYIFKSLIALSEAWKILNKGIFLGNKEIVRSRGCIEQIG